jgi:oligopeptidase B
MAVGHVFAGMADPQVTGMEGGLSRARTGTSKNRSSEQTYYSPMTNMKQNRVAISILTLIMTFSISNPTFSQTADKQLKPPAVNKIPKDVTAQGDKRIDDYFWLREKGNPAVLAYLQAENAYTDEFMKPTLELQDKLYKEMLGRIKQTDLGVPYRLGGYFYYTRTVEGKQYPIYCRKKGSLSAEEEITLDMNEMAKGLKFLSIGNYSISDDGNILAYSTDSTGYRQYTLHFKDLRTGEVLPDHLERVTSAVWAADNKTMLAVTEDDVTKRSDKFWRHTLGVEKNDLVYEEKDELYDIRVSRTRDRKYAILQSESKTTTEQRYIPSDSPSSEPKVILPRESDHEYYVDHRDGLFYIRTNKGAKNFKLVTAPVATPEPGNWKEIIAPRKSVKLEVVDLFANDMVVTEREDGLLKLQITSFRDGKKQNVSFPEAVYTAGGSANPEYDTNLYRFNYQSMVTPGSVFDYDMNTGKRTLLKQNEVLGGYEPSKYNTERIYATATDGTKIPMSIVYKKGLKLDGKNPVLLYGYGSYGISIDPTFSSPRLSLLDRGVVYVIAHIRGGGELGEEWKEAGRMMKKRATFTDFVASAEYLIKAGYTSSDRLVIQGGSAGGLLMGAVTNLRPDLFKAVVAQVPFVDVVNTMLDASLPLTTSEYLEWGNPNIKKEYDYIRTYSPYDNIAAKKYPTMLIKVSLNDSQVPYWEGAKFAAKLRATKTDDNPLLLKTNMGAGHGGASGRYDALHESAFDYAFILMEMGITR